VHCGAGISRGPTAVIAYLMASSQRFAYGDARRLVAAARPCTRPNDGFVRALRRYEGLLRARDHGDSDDTAAAAAAAAVRMEAAN
jgi:protein-tyrosine phosphatase